MNSLHRILLTLTGPAVVVAVATAVALPTTTHAQPAQACSLAGSWTLTTVGGPAAGSHATLTLGPGGAGAMDIAFTPVIHIDMRYTAHGNQLVLNDMRSTPPPVACPASQAGTYTVAFGPGCGTATLTAATDGCAGRNGTLNHAALTRGGGH